MLQNFRVIMKYNPAEAYALAIGHFADACAAARPSCRPGGQERELSRAERLELQQLLAQRASIRARPTASSAARPGRPCAGSRPRSGPADGFASSDALERLRGIEQGFFRVKSNPEHHNRRGLDGGAGRLFGQAAACGPNPLLP